MDGRPSPSGSAARPRSWPSSSADAGTRPTSTAPRRRGARRAARQRRPPGTSPQSTSTPTMVAGRRDSGAQAARAVPGTALARHRAARPAVRAARSRGARRRPLRASRPGVGVMEPRSGAAAEGPRRPPGARARAEALLRAPPRVARGRRGPPRAGAMPERISAVRAPSPAANRRPSPRRGPLPERPAARGRPRGRERGAGRRSACSGLRISSRDRAREGA